ncbi:MAG: ABC transporter permease [Acidimicrobiales bacterium]
MATSTKPDPINANSNVLDDAADDVTVVATERVRDDDTTALGRWGRFKRSFRQFRKDQPLGMISAGIVIFLLLCAIFAGLIAPYSPTATQRGREFKLAAPSLDHLFGTDHLGRDIFSRVLYGAQISLIVATATVIISTVIGTLLGAISGYFGGKLDMILQRIVDAIMSIPVLILALFIVSLLGSSIANVILALSIIYIPRFSRIARGEMLRVQSAEYVTAAEALGAPPMRVIMRHGIPNIVAPIIILASLTFGQAIVAEAALSFLGVGAPITEPSWGQMLSISREYMTIAWWTVVFPGAALSLGVLAFNLLGDALRDHLDPKLVR